MTTSVRRGLPLPIRNRLADLVVAAFDEAPARETLDALGAFCAGRTPGDEGCGRLLALGWFRQEEDGALRLLGAHEAFRVALCDRVRAALETSRPHGALPARATVAGAVARAGALWDRELYFEVHECLEPAWMRSDAAERWALQGLIQVAVAFQHATHGNREGAITLLAEGLGKLEASGDALPIPAAARQAWTDRLRTALRALCAGGDPPAPPWPSGGRDALPAG